MRLINNILDRIGPGQEAYKQRPYVVFKKERSPLGRKLWRMKSDIDGSEMLTPWGRKEKARRRARRKIAHESRRVNRRYRATGGLK